MGIKFSLTNNQNNQEYGFAIRDEHRTSDDNWLKIAHNNICWVWKGRKYTNDEKVCSCSAWISNTQGWGTYFQLLGEKVSKYVSYLFSCCKSDSSINDSIERRDSISDNNNIITNNNNSISDNNNNSISDNNNSIIEQVNEQHVSHITNALEVQPTELPDVQQNVQ